MPLTRQEIRRLGFDLRDGNPTAVNRVRCVFAASTTVADAAFRLGIPVTTLRKWLRTEDGIESVRALRDVLPMPTYGGYPWPDRLESQDER